MFNKRSCHFELLDATQIAESDLTDYQGNLSAFASLSQPRKAASRSDGSACTCCSQLAPAAVTQA